MATIHNQGRTCRYLNEPFFESNGVPYHIFEKWYRYILIFNKVISHLKPPRQHFYHYQLLAIVVQWAEEEKMIKKKRINLMEIGNEYFKLIKELMDAQQQQCYLIQRLLSVDDDIKALNKEFKEQNDTIQSKPEEERTKEDYNKFFDLNHYCPVKVD